MDSTLELMSVRNELQITQQKLTIANMDLQAKELEIEEMKKTIEVLEWRISVQDLLINQTKEIADRLLEKVETSASPMIGKKEIMDIFNKESDFALRFLRSAKAMGYGIQVGKEYYIKREELEKILHDYQGLKLEM